MDATQRSITESTTEIISDREITLQLIPSFTRLVRLKDAATHEHSERVSQLAKEWAGYMVSRQQWGHVDIAGFELSALLHDIGKVGILNQVLNKAESLSEFEREHLEQHPEIGFQMICQYPGVETIAEGVRHHHERWDGQGYPQGLREDKIPWFARAIAIIDAFDAMTSARTYRQTVSEKEAIHELISEAGQQFDPDLVRDFAQFLYSRNT